MWMEVFPSTSLISHLRTKPKNLKFQLEHRPEADLQHQFARIQVLSCTQRLITQTKPFPQHRL